MVRVSARMIEAGAASQHPPNQTSHEPFLSLHEMEADYIRRVLKSARGKINGPGGAAELLKMNPGTLRAKMDKLGIAYGRKAVT